MKIVQLSAENFKRLTAVSIKPNGSLCEITGRNGQGKSSVLDAIQAAFGGKTLSPEMPIKRGASGATVVVETDTIKVTRKWTSKGDTLVVQSQDGTRYGSPQAMLDKLVGDLSFDPLAFSRLPAKQQAATLREVTGIDTSELDRQRADVYARRTAVNTDVRQREAQRDAVVIPDHPGEIGEEIDLAGVAEKKPEAEREKAANDKIRREAEDASEALGEIADEVQRFEEEIERLGKLLALAKQRKEEALTTYNAARLHYASVRQRQKHAEAHEAAKQRWAELDTAIHQQRSVADQHTRRLEEIDNEKARMLAEAKFPVAGMSVEGDRVLIDGVPYSQASSAEQIRIGLAMGAALNPQRRVILVRDGSLLDAESLHVVADWAAEHDMQVWIERVTSNGDGVGVVIEDGMLADAPAPRAAEEVPELVGAN